MAIIVSIVQSKLLIILLTIACIISFFWYYEFRKPLGMNCISIILVILYQMVVGVICTVLFAKFEEFISPTHVPSNLRLYGPIFFMWFFNLILSIAIRRDYKVILDLYTPGLILSLILGRLNCFRAGCCIGKIIPGTEIRYPIREAELVFEIIMLIIVVSQCGKKKFDGSLYPLYAMSYGIFRFIIEFFRIKENTLFGIQIPHIWSIIAIVAGAFFYYSLRNNPNPIKSSKRS